MMPGRMYTLNAQNKRMYERHERSRPDKLDDVRRRAPELK